MQLQNLLQVTYLFHLELSMGYRGRSLLLLNIENGALYQIPPHASFISRIVVENDLSKSAQGFKTIQVQPRYSQIQQL